MGIQVVRNWYTTSTIMKCVRDSQEKRGAPRMVEKAPSKSTEHRYAHIRSTLRQLLRWGDLLFRGKEYNDGIRYGSFRLKQPQLEKP